MAARLTSPSCSYCLELQIDRLSLVTSKTFSGSRSLGRFACFLRQSFKWYCQFLIWVSGRTKHDLFSSWAKDKNRLKVSRVT